MSAVRLSRRGFLLTGAALLGSTASPATALAAPTRPGPPAYESIAGTGAVRPGFVGAAGWAARPPNGEILVRPERPVRILVHHTAGPNVTDLSRAAADAVARDIQDFHMDGRGWMDSGQHLTISRGGFVLEGRHRSLEVLDAGRRAVQGAHCTGQNVVAVGIENEGTYDAEDVPQVQWDRLRETCAYVCAQYGIAATEIYGHRDFQNTICPGQVLYDRLPQLRTEVAGLLAQPLTAAQAEKAHWPALAAGSRGDAVAAAQHLLRAAGYDVTPDAEYGDATVAAVRRFQADTSASEVNGVLAGESWPVLVEAARPAENQDAARAVALLAEANGVNAESVPDEPDAADWQELLGTGGAPVPEHRDPPGVNGR